MTGACMVVLAVLAAAPLFEQGVRPLRDVTPPAEVGSLSARACGECHEAEYRQWAGSRHASAYTNPLFTASLERAPQAWCLNCHTPLPEQRRSLREEGVNCAACHVRGGEVLTAREPDPAALSAHPVRREPKLATAEFCGGCHQFNVPVHGAPTFQYSSTPMQKTLSEWAASTAAARGVTCQGCHMPEGRHSFPGVHSPGLVAGALSVSFSREGERLVAEVRARDVGHRVPSGDPFRRLRLRLCQEPSCATPLATRLLMRRFDMRPDGWVLATDTTVPVETATTEPVRRLEFPLTAPLPEVLHWRLDYLLAEPELEGRVAPEELCLPLHEGTLPLRYAVDGLRLPARPPRPRPHPGALAEM